MLSDKQILEAMEQGNIIIEPFDKRHLGTNSYDCRLGEYYYQGSIDMKEMSLDNPEQLRAYWGEVCKAQDGRIPIYPGMTILAHTQEVIGGKNGFVAKMYCRSTVARSCLSVCRCAGLADSGYIARFTMEISNISNTLIYVPVNYRICQMAFFRTEPPLKEYHGSYGQQTEWTPEDMLPSKKPDWAVAEYRDR